MKSSGKKDRSERDQSNRHENAVEEFPAMGVSWKELQEKDGENGGSSEEDGQVSDDVGEEAYDSSYEDNNNK